MRKVRSQAVQVTEWDEPQAVIGSYPHQVYVSRLVWRSPGRSQELVHAPPPRRRGVILRGEYLFVAEGAGGCASMTWPTSATRACRSDHHGAVLAAGSRCARAEHQRHLRDPAHQPVAPPQRNVGDPMRVTNQEQAFHPIYNYAFIVDSVEGLIVVNVNTFADGEPRNNFLKREITWNDGGVLKGARHITLGHAYVTTDSGLVILNLNDPLKPKPPARAVDGPARLALQFRYLFVTTKEGLEVIDVTWPEKPRWWAPPGQARRRTRHLPRPHLCLCAAGKDGLSIIDIEKPHAPFEFKRFNAEGKLNDATDVIVGTTNASCSRMCRWAERVEGGAAHVTRFAAQVLWLLAGAESKLIS